MKKTNISPERPDLFGALFKNAKINCVIIMDEDGIIRHINDAFINAFGYTGRDIIGKHMRVLFTEHDRKALRPELELIMVKKQGFSTDQNYTIHKNGNYIWVSGESVWIENKQSGNCIVKVIQNIHSQKLQEKFLAEANEFSQTIFQSIGDPLLVVTHDLRVLKANAAFFRVFDISPDTMEGANPSALNQLLQEGLHLQEKLEKFAAAGEAREEIEWKIPGGNSRTFRLAIKSLDHDVEKEKPVLLLFHDITQEKQAGQQREDLINFVSHELRNPLANLALIVELLPGAIQQSETAETAEYLDKAKANLGRLKQVIGELHDVTRAGTGQLTMQLSTFNLADMVNEAIDTVRLLHPSHSIVAPVLVDQTIHADRFRLVQVLNNYLTNAIKYSPGTGEVILDISLVNNELIFSVTDHGPGIPADQLQYVFNKYYRGRSPARVDGLGLGLYVCKEIISRHGGKVWAESVEGAGSTFFFSIPL